MMGYILDPMAVPQQRRGRRGYDRRGAVQQRSFRDKAKQWCRGRNCWIRLPIALWFVFVFFAYLRSPDGATSVDFVNSQLHAIGHTVWNIVFGGAIEWIGGITIQFIVPLLALEYFRRKFELFGCAACLGWFGTNLMWNSAYIDGALSGSYPPGASSATESLHDWNLLLSGLDELDNAEVFANAFFFFGGLALVAALFMAGQQLIYMITLEENRHNADRRAARIARGET